MLIVIIFSEDVDMNKEINKDTDDSSILSAFHREKYLPKWPHFHLLNMMFDFHSFPNSPFFH